MRVVQGDTVLREETVTAASWSYDAAAQAGDGLSGGFGNSGWRRCRRGSGRGCSPTLAIGA